MTNGGSMTRTQRWREGRASYRPAREVVSTRHLEVVELPDDRTASQFVAAHHYSRSYPAARWRFGLYERGTLSGVAVFSQPMNDRALTNVFGPITRTDAAELGRLVLLDEVGANAESWFVARCFARLRLQGLRGVLSFADPVRRVTTDGRVVMPGHVGIVYQALNARYLGRSTPRRLQVLPDGTIASPRALQKIRGAERGWRAAVALLVSHGAEPLEESAGRAERLEWLGRTLGSITRPLKHGGNHRYAWALDRRLDLPPASGDYPKLEAA